LPQQLPILILLLLLLLLELIFNLCNHCVQDDYDAARLLFGLNSASAHLPNNNSNRRESVSLLEDQHGNFPTNSNRYGDSSGIIIIIFTVNNI